MGEAQQPDQAVKEALKRLRQKRQERIREVAEQVKVQKAELKAIREQLAADGEGTTPPRLAEGTGIEVSRVMWYLATLKRYGEVVEGAKDGGWFRYRLADNARQSGGEEQ